MSSQSLHNRRRSGVATDWATIAGVYDALVTFDATVGAAVARSAAHLEAGNIDVARSILDGFEVGAIAGYQPYWAVRAEVLRRSHAPAEAVVEAQVRAIGLATDPAVAAHLREKYDVQDDPTEVVA